MEFNYVITECTAVTHPGKKTRVTLLLKLDPDKELRVSVHIVFSLLWSIDFQNEIENSSITIDKSW